MYSASVLPETVPGFEIATFAVAAEPPGYITADPVSGLQAAFEFGLVLGEVPLYEKQVELLVLGRFPRYSVPDETEPFAFVLSAVRSANVLASVKQLSPPTTSALSRTRFTTHVCEWVCR
jgi:hypothetical protein